MLRYPMEERQLDFNQPFLSVRRFSSTASASEVDHKKTVDKPVPKLPPLPFYKSELKSGPIRNPGTVPFVWEKIPGKPKDERKSRPQLPQQPPIAPKPPPGWASNINQDSGISTPSSRDALELNEDEVEEEEEEEGQNGKSSSDDGDEAYLDALDTLSRSESFSVSGVSGLDGPDLKESGTFSADPQTRDFMMGRFLPAAKAMASETPQYAPKKQPLTWDRARQVDKKRLRPPNQYQLDGSLPPYAQELRAVESDNESDIGDGSDVVSAKVCGFFPRFCLKSSFFLMNPVPGVKLQSRLPASSARRVRGNSSSAASYSSETKHVEDVLSEARFNEENLERKCKPDEIGEKNVSKGHKQVRDLTPTRNRFSHSKLPEPKGFLGEPTKANNSAPKSRPRNFRELLADENAENEVGSGIPVIEKTLYIDSVHKPKSPSSNSSSSDRKSLEDEVEVPGMNKVVEESLLLDSSARDIKHLSFVTEKAQVRPNNLESDDPHSYEKQNGSRRDRDLIRGSLALVVSKVGFEETCLANDSINIEKKISDFVETPGERKKIDSKTPKIVKLDSEEKSTTETKMPENGLINSESRWIVKLGTEERPHESFMQMTLTLPSPKSPSESWLKRALPVASSRNSRSTLASRIGIGTPMESPLDPKWETIVKTSNVQQGGLLFSKEHLSTIPEA